MHTNLSAIDRKLKRNIIIQSVMRLARGDCWLVGGYIRDLLIRERKIRRPVDLDFILDTPPQKLARALREKFGGTIVSLREESIVRLVLPKGDVIDLSLIDQDITRDLKSRDFTINAIAWRPIDGFTDPTGGIDDLRMKRIRHISAKNLKADPLRLIRAYRFRSLSGFSIDHDTRKAIKRLSSLSSCPANERITYELIRILSELHYIKALKEAAEDSVLTSITGLSRAALMENIRTIGRVEKRKGRVSAKWLREGIGQEMDNSIALRLSTLLLGSNADNLSLNRAYYERLRNINTYLADFKALRSSDREGIFRLLMSAGVAYIDMALISDKKWALKEYIRYFRQLRQPFVNAKELMESYGVEKGPEIGKTLRAIEKERFIGKLSKKVLLSRCTQDNLRLL